MSGPSTLRLCFAAMAPALTEAASARLKLQDHNNKRGETGTVHPECKAIKSDHISLHKQNARDLNSFTNCDLTKTDDIVVDLASITEGTRSDEVRSPPKGRGGGLALTLGIPVPASKKIKNSPSIDHLTKVKLTASQLNCLLNGGEEIKTSFIKSLKRMNQPYIATTNSNDRLEVSNKQIFINSNSSSDTLRKLASKISQSGMVNGDSGHNGQKEEEVPVRSQRKSDTITAVSSCVSNDGDKSVSKIAKETCNNTLKSVLTLDSQKEPLINKTKVMGMCVDNHTTSVVPHHTEKAELTYQGETKLAELQKPCDEMRKECVKKQAHLERRVEMLLRRLKRVKGKVVENHTKEQLVQYVNFQHRNLQMVAKSIKKEAPCPDVLKEHFLSNDDVKNMSTAQLVKLVRDHQSNKSLGIPDKSSGRLRMVNTSAVIMSPNLHSQALSVAEKLNARIHTVEQDLDSDATASSSGGESSEEESLPLSTEIGLPSLLKRAEWKWVAERAAIVSRWTWLQAQVSDLEFKIRQQSQIHRQLRSSKGGVVLGDPPTASDIFNKLQGLKPNTDDSSKVNNSTHDDSSSLEISPCNVSRLMSNVDKQASRLSQTLNCLSPASSTLGSPHASRLSSPVVNGVEDSPSNSSLASEFAGSTADNSPLITASSSSSHLSHPSAPEFPSSHSVPDASCQAARCRPLRSYRKRKILRTIDLYKASIKAAKLSDVRCRCFPPGSPCAMCGGRLNNRIGMDADNMSFNERVALLDPAFHPVLSFPRDIPLTVYCEGYLKCGLWQGKSRRPKSHDHRRSKTYWSIPEPVRKTQGNKISAGRGSGFSTSPSMLNLTAKIKNKYDGKVKVKKTSPLGNHKKNDKVKKKAVKKKLSKAMKKKEEEEDDLDDQLLDGNSLSSSTRDRLPTQSQNGAANRKRRTMDNSYDINNVEIPQCFAATTRVEKLEYKEIDTPKWRVVEESSSTDNFPISNAVDDSSNSNALSLPPPAPNSESMTVKPLEKTNGVCLALDKEQRRKMMEAEQAIEDTSDEAYALRHSEPEQEERKRFRNFVQYPPVRRSRARSDAFLPSSRQQIRTVTDYGDGELRSYPAEELTGSNLHRSLPMLPTLDDSSNQSTSSKKRSKRDRERTSSTGLGDCNPETRSVRPWPARQFPLTDSEHDKMQMDALPSITNVEPIHQTLPHRVKTEEPSGKVYVGGDTEEDGMVSRQSSRAPSPHPSVESASSIGDDPNDPDWVTSVDGSRNRIGKISRNSSIVDNDPDWTGSDYPKKGKKR